MRDNMKKQLCIDTVRQVTEKFGNLQNVILHSDRGSQYTSAEFREELKNYFEEFLDRYRDNDIQLRSVYRGFLYQKFTTTQEETNKEEHQPSLVLDCKESIFDKIYAECPAQYANSYGTPCKKWSEVTTKLKDIDTKKLHFVMMPKDHIFIDFDLKDENGEKSFEKNLEAASKWPATYSEISKSGSGIHLHYTYLGDVSQLSRLYSENIEIKVFTGNSSLRRQLTKCNNLDVSSISSGLPLKGIKMINLIKFLRKNKRFQVKDLW